MKVVLLIFALVAAVLATPLQEDFVEYLPEGYVYPEVPVEEFVEFLPEGFLNSATGSQDFVEFLPEGFENSESDSQDFVEFLPEGFVNDETPVEEFGPEFVPEWNLIPDGDGNMHLANMHGDHEEPDIGNLWNPVSDVIFRLFTNRNPTAGQVLTVGNAASIANSQFRAAEPTRFIIHGWNNNGGSAVNTRIRNAYISRGGINVIVVDWGAGAQTGNYAAARNRVGDVGRRVAAMADFLNLNSGHTFANMAVVGHSLGGHASGHAGKAVARGRLSAVVALDPAGPGFSENQPGQRVAATDANYVEIIHTNGGVLGMHPAIGMADHYPNFGRSQPGCGVDVAGSCAHSRAWEFFAESITTNTHFTARLCRNIADINNNNCVSSGTQRRMGGHPLTTAARGIYWCSTNANAPFARGAAGA